MNLTEFKAYVDGWLRDIIKAQRMDTWVTGIGLALVAGAIGIQTHVIWTLHTNEINAIKAISVNQNQTTNLSPSDFGLFERMALEEFRRQQRAKNADMSGVAKPVVSQTGRPLISPE